MNRSILHASIECTCRKLIPHVERLEDRLPFCAGSLATFAETPETFDLFATASTGDFEVQTGEFTVGVQTQATHIAPAAACLRDESQIVVFAAESNGQISIMGRRLPTNHSQVKNAFTVKTLSTADGPFANVAVVQSGDGYAVVWATDLGISAQRFDGLDNPLGATVHVADDFRVRHLFAVAHATGYSIVWESETTAGATALSHSTFDHGGTLLTDQQTLMSGSVGGNSFLADFDVFEHPTLAFAYSWSEFDIGTAELTSMTVGEYDSESDSQAFVSVPVSEDWWAPPSVAALGPAEYVIAGQRYGNGTDETFLQHLNANGEILNDVIVNESTSEFDSYPEIARLQDDGIVVLFYEYTSDQIIATQFNSSLEQLATWSINDTPVVSPDLKKVVPSNDGFSIYRSGYTLNEDPGTIVHRAFRLQATNLAIAADDELLQAASVVEIAGIPDEAGLNRGWRSEDDESIWHVPVHAIDGLQVLSDEFMEPFSLDIRLLSAAEESLADFQAEVGSEDTDRLFGELTRDLIDGLGSDDEVTLTEKADEYVGEWETETLALITHTDSQATVYLHSIENLTFDDVAFSVEEFIALFEPTDDPVDDGSGEDQGDDSGDDESGSGDEPDEDNSSGDDDTDGNEAGDESNGDETASGDDTSGGESPDDSGDEDGADDQDAPQPDDNDVGDDGTPDESNDDEDGDVPTSDGDESEADNSDEPNYDETEDPPLLGSGVSSQQQINDAASAIASAGLEVLQSSGVATFSGTTASEGLTSSELGTAQKADTGQATTATTSSGTAAANAGTSSLNELKDLAGAILDSLEEKLAGATDGNSDGDSTSAGTVDANQRQSVAVDEAIKSATIFDDAESKGDQSATRIAAKTTPHNEDAPASAQSNAAAMPGGEMAMTQMVALINDEFATASAENAADTLATIDEIFSDHELVTGVAVVVASGASLAQLAWLLRGSVLMTKLLSSMPVWSTFDPLPILSNHGATAGLPQNDESLIDIAQT